MNFLRSERYVKDCNDSFEKNVHREYEDALVWLEEVVAETKFVPSSSANNVPDAVPLLPKTPSQKQAKRGRKRAKPPATVDLNSLQPERIRGGGGDTVVTLRVPRIAEEPSSPFVAKTSASKTATVSKKSMSATKNSASSAKKSVSASKKCAPASKKSESASKKVKKSDPKPIDKLLLEPEVTTAELIEQMTVEQRERDSVVRQSYLEESESEPEVEAEKSGTKKPSEETVHVPLPEPLTAVEREPAEPEHFEEMEAEETVPQPEPLNTEREPVETVRRSKSLSAKRGRVRELEQSESEPEEITVPCPAEREQEFTNTATATSSARSPKRARLDADQPQPQRLQEPPSRLGPPISRTTTVSSLESEALTDTESDQPTAKRSRFFTPVVNKAGPSESKVSSLKKPGYFSSLLKNSASKPLTNLASNVTSFIKRNTPQKSQQNDAIEKLKMHESRYQEAQQKKEELLRQKIEEQKRKREERQAKVAAAKEQQKTKESQQKKKIVEKHSAAETLKEMETKKLQQQKLSEIEMKKNQKDEATKLKFKQQVELLRKQKEDEEKQENSKVTTSAKQKSIMEKSISLSKMNPVHDASSNPDSYAMTPLRQLKPSTANNYDIADLHSGDETDDADAPKKKIPCWALGNMLKAALVHQYYANVDVVKLFGRMVPPDLAKMGFKSQNRRFHTRTSSGKWNTSFYPFAEPSS